MAPRLLPIVATTTFLLIFSVVLTAQIAMISSQPMESNSAELHGALLGPNSKPLEHVRVEVDESSTAIPVAATYTGKSGTFLVRNLPHGTYELVAEQSDTEVRELVAVDGAHPSVELRLAPKHDWPPASPIVSAPTLVVPDRARNYYAKAYRAFTAGNYKGAQSYLDQALGVEPLYADAITLKGLIAMNKNDLAGAQGLLQRAASLDPSLPAPSAALAAIYNHFGRFTDAVQVANHAIAVDPLAWQGYLELAKATLGLNSPRLALKFLRDAEKLGGNKFAEVHLVKSYCLFALGLYPYSKYEAQAVVSHHPSPELKTQANAVLVKLASTNAGPAHITGLALR